MKDGHRLIYGEVVHPRFPREKDTAGIILLNLMVVSGRK